MPMKCNELIYHKFRSPVQTLTESFKKRKNGSLFLKCHKKVVTSISSFTDEETRRKDLFSINLGLSDWGQLSSFDHKPDRTLRLLHSRKGMEMECLFLVVEFCVCLPIHNAAFTLTVGSSAYLMILLEVRCIEMIVLQLEAAHVIN